MIDNFTEIVGDQNYPEAELHKDEVVVKLEISEASKILERFALDEVPEKLTFASGKAQEFIVELFVNAGVDISPESIRKPIFVSADLREKLFAELNLDDDASGFSNRLFGYPIIFIGKDFCAMDYANIVCHEMLHFSSKTVVSTTETKMTQTRRGMYVEGVTPKLDQWFFEEAFAYYFAAQFSEQLNTEPLFLDDSIRKSKLINEFAADGDFVDGRLYFFNDLSIDPKYVNLLKGNDGSDTFSFSSDSMTGDLLKIIMNNFDEQEKSNLISYLLKSRIELNNIGKFANMINEKFGRGTYTRLARCKRDDDMTIQKLIKEFSNFSVGESK